MSIKLVYHLNSNGEMVVERIVNVPMLALPTVYTYAPTFRNGLQRQSLMDNYCQVMGDNIPLLMAALGRLGYIANLVDVSEQ